MIIFLLMQIMITSDAMAQRHRICIVVILHW